MENYDWYLKHVHLVAVHVGDEVALMERELARAIAHLALEEHAQPRPSRRSPTVATAEEWQRGASQDAVTAYMPSCATSRSSR